MNKKTIKILTYIYCIFFSFFCFYAHSDDITDIVQNQKRQDNLDQIAENISGNHYAENQNNDVFIHKNNKDFYSSDVYRDLFLYSKAVLVKDFATGKVIYEKNTDTARSIASISKLMAAIVLLEGGLDMNEPVMITEAEIDRLKGTKSRLSIGTILSRRELLHIGLMSSENRAIHALARTYPGGFSVFIRKMNEKAMQIGMYNTQFYDPTGLEPRNRSTANDLYILVKEANKFPLIKKFSTSNFNQVKTSAGKIENYKNTNALVRKSMMDIQLQKTGYIKESGRNMVVLANISGRPVTMILLGAPDTNARIEDAVRIKDKVFFENSQNRL